MANTAVSGIYASARQVENAVDELKDAGYRNTDISVLFGDSKWVDRAKKILENTGAEDVASSSESKGDFANSKRPALKYGD